MTLTTPVLTAVASPRLVIGAPHLMTIGNGGLCTLLYSVTLDIVVAGFSLAAIQAFLMIKTYQNPYFYQAWFARLSRRHTKTLLPSKGNRYSGF